MAAHSHSYHAARRRPRQRSRVLFALAGGALIAVSGLMSAAQAQVGAQVEVVEVEGLIDPVVAGFLVDVIERANADGAELVAIALDSPGGFGGAAERVVAAIDASEVPVLAYVGPAGARAAGTAAVIANAAHLLAASPVTQMGAIDGLGLDRPAGDRAATARALGARAAARGRDPALVEQMVTDDLVLTLLPDGGDAASVPRDAVIPGGVARPLTPELALGRGVLDLVEPSLGAALSAAGGTQVSVAGANGAGRERTLEIDAATANVRFHNLGLVQQVLHTVANPTLAYLLLVAGALALAFEWFQPGFGVAGGSGLGLIALGLYGFVVLPGSWLGLVLLAAGLVLLSVDLAVGGLGPGTLGGTALFGLGSWLLFPGTAPLRLSTWLIAALTGFAVLFFVVIMTVVLRAQGGQAQAGAENLVGKTGVVRSVLNPEGHVFIDGALWRARAPEAAGRVKTGTAVRVVQLDDQLTLDVELLPEPAGNMVP